MKLTSICIALQQIDDRHYQLQVGSKQVDLKGIPATLVTNLVDRDAPRNRDF